MNIDQRSAHSEPLCLLRLFNLIVAVRHLFEGFFFFCENELPRETVREDIPNSRVRRYKATGRPLWTLLTPHTGKEVQPRELMVGNTESGSKA